MRKFFLGSVIASLLGALAVPSLAVDHETIRALARQGEMDSALQLSRIALEKDSSDQSANFMVAKLIPEGKVSAQYFHRVLKLGDAGTEVEESNFRLGQYYFATGKYYRSIPFFRDYLQQFPKGDWTAPALYWMGNACFAYAQSVPEKAVYFDSALIYFQQLIVGLNTDEYYLPLALVGQAKTQAAQGNRIEAWASVVLALEKAPAEERGAVLLLSAQLRQGIDREEEKRLINHLVSQYPQSPEVSYLRKLNTGTAQPNWKSGTGQPNPRNNRAISAKMGKDSVESKLASTIPTTLAKKSDQKFFTLQLGAFSQSSNAKAMIANLSKLGFSPELRENPRNGKTIFQVRLGQFSTPEDATEYAQKNLKPHKLLSQPVPLVQ